MSLFKKEKKEVPSISTASLPDIVFILLFFFMVVTKMREISPKVQVKLPAATELTKMEPKQLHSRVYVGVPTEKYAAKYGTAPRLQLNDQLATPTDIPLFVANVKDKLGSKAGDLRVCLRVDGNVTMGIVTDVKTELRKVRQYAIAYSARPGDVKTNFE